MYTLLIAIIYLAFISLGLPDSLLGSAWPIMHADINVPLSLMGLISIIVSGGTIISSLFSDKLIRKFGTQAITTVSIFLTAIALLGFSYSTNIWLIIIFAIPYGFGAGAIDAALNNYVALHYSSRHMSWLHCFWGVGTIISPFVMSYSLTNYTWSVGYRIVAFIQVSIAIVLLISKPLWKIHKQSPNDTVEEHNNLGLMSALKIKGVKQLLVGFASYCAAEGTAMAWSCTYLVEAKQMDEVKAAAFASLFFIGMTVGRFLSGFITNRLGDKKMIFVGGGIAFLGVILILLPSNNINLSLTGLVILGLGCAPIYPSIIHSTPENFGAENSGSIIGIQMAGAYTGAILFPPLFGVISKLLGFHVLPIYIGLFMALTIIMLKQTFTLTNK